jgi:hypothetical protein
MVLLWLVKDLQSAMELSDSLRDQVNKSFLNNIPPVKN